MDNLLNFDLASILLIISSFAVAVISIITAYTSNLIYNIILMSLFSLFISICYLFMDAPDVAMTEVALGACLSTLILLTILKIVKISKEEGNLKHKNINKPTFKINFKIILSLALCITFVITLTFIGLNLPIYGDLSSPVNAGLSKYYIENIHNDIGIPSVVAGILASYRGFDTLGETSVILIAGLSVVLILSEKPETIRC